MNNVTISTGITNGGSFPVVGKNYFITPEDVTNRDINTYAYSYYERMVITIAQDGNQWVWREEEVVDEIGGLLSISYEYNTYSANGITYTGRKFNFFPYQSSTVFEMDINNNIKPLDTTNNITGLHSVIPGGENNIISGSHSNINGGKDNSVLNNNSNIGGGYNNKINSLSSNIGGGEENITNGNFSSILGGRGNITSTYGEVVGGLFATEKVGDTSTFSLDDRVFTIGNGQNEMARSDAFSIRKDGLVTLPSTTNALLDQDQNPKAVVTKEYLTSLVESNESLEEFEVIETSVGKYNHGDIIPAHSSSNERWKDIGRKRVLPTFNPPILNMASSITSSNTSFNSSYEVGSVASIELIPTFNKRDGGDLNNIEISQDSTSLYSNNTLPSPNQTSTITFSTTPIQFKTEVDYDEGTISKLDSLGDTVGNTILAGSITSNLINYRGYRAVFYGSNPTKIVNSSNIRPNLNIRLENSGNTFTLNSGNTNKIFHLWLPNGKNLTSVIDADALNADLTASYIPTLNFSVEDIGGNSIPGTLFTMEADVPYASNHRHVITIS